MTWREILRGNFRDREELAEFLEIEAIAETKFPLNVPRRLAEKMGKGNLDDPLLRQYVALGDELEVADGFGCDPVGDLAARNQPRLLRKYAGRALLLASSACAMHCRYCFRRNFPYEQGPTNFDAELNAIANDTTLREVILSGGDPLSLSNRALQNLITKLDAIPHLRLLRFHSRFPIGIPERIDTPFLAIFKNLRLQPWFITHINHPRELDADVTRALQSLNMPLLNQAVLLRGVNDDIETLTTLCESLIYTGIQPYYLHQLDRVQGAHHFEVPTTHGLQLIAQLRERLPGYAVPTYVREEAGALSKTPLSGRCPEPQQGLAALASRF